MDDLTPTDHEIRAAIRKAIQAQKVTQNELAQRLGVKQPSVADLLSGRRGRVPQSLVDLLEVLGLELMVQPKGRQ
ncbi:XRE family transcriptional regulator [Deinococcus hopiensis]|uniref:Helix-turn-helix domain-containing protein n=1 Tax=Deinococcus hopiensis KR-140 TaxID=695939 RepID=A0A1W1V8B5_9DEIO|nr:XRE family transcriptional regulator [Deinococcus hopiensis]SMB89244.1 Helix-turn-helix domain-containing protein [Deinococcus hopiensis KR-140]